MKIEARTTSYSTNTNLEKEVKVSRNRSPLLLTATAKFITSYFDTRLCFCCFAMLVEYNIRVEYEDSEKKRRRRSTTWNTGEESSRCLYYHKDGMTELVVTGVSCREWSMRVCAHNHKTFFRSHNGWMCLNHHWRDIRNWFSRWEKCTVMICNNSGIRTRKRLITLLEIVMIHILSMAMLEIKRNILCIPMGTIGSSYQLCWRCFHYWGNWTTVIDFSRYFLISH